MKKCPFCAEEIQDEAIKCRYCGERLDKVEQPPPPPVVLSANEIRCSSCGHVGTRGPSNCPACGRAHREGAATPLNGVRCVGCGAVGPPGPSHCQKCGRAYGREFAAGRVLKQARAVAGLVGFVGLWFLGMGVSEYYGGSETKSMYRGTVVENNPDANQITNNAMSGGETKIVIGAVAVLLGAGIAAAGQRWRG